MGKLLAQLDHIVTFGLEQLEKGAQMRGGQRRAAAMVRASAMHDVMHASAEVFRVRWSEMRMVMQALTSQHFTKLDAPRASGFRPDHRIVVVRVVRTAASGGCESGE